MLNWLLIVSITLVSTSMLVFLSAYLAILEQTGLYYKKTRSEVLLLSNTFNLFYILITPLLFPFLKKHYSLLVVLSVGLTAVGCVGRYLCFQNYDVALVMSILVAIGHIPIITAPYGLLDLFKPEERGYAATIPLFVPTLGTNFSIFYGMKYIASEFSEVIVFDKHSSINSLNLIIAVVGCLSCIATIVFIFLLRKEIRAINQQATSDSRSVLNMIRSDLQAGKAVMVMLFSWGVILGLNWTYGGMFGVFLGGTGLPHKEIANIGLYANLSSVVFSNLGVWVTNRFRFNSMAVILVLNSAGFLASLYIYGSTSINYYLFHDERLLIIAIVILRAGFSSFVSLALLQLSSFAPSVLMSSVFFYIANISNYLTIELVDRTANSFSLLTMSIIVLVAIISVQVSSMFRPQGFNKNRDTAQAQKIYGKDEGNSVSNEEFHAQPIE